MSINLDQLLRSPRALDPKAVCKGDNVTVESPTGRVLFEATIRARGMLFSKPKNDSWQTFEITSPDQLTWARNDKTGEEYNLFARVDDKGLVHYVYDPEAEFQALVVMIGGQPRVRPPPFFF